MNDDANYREFEEALTDVLAENEYILKRRTRLATARRPRSGCRLGPPFASGTTANRTFSALLRWCTDLHQWSPLFDARLTQREGGFCSNSRSCSICAFKPSGISGSAFSSD
jgi:hypothetical protein